MVEVRAEGAKTLSAEEIAEILPHRYPFALVDRIEDYEPGQFAIGKKCVTINEPFFQGHFPGNPIMPGVLILEALAQVGAVSVLSMPENRGKIAVFGGVKKCRFKKQVVPGDVLIMSCEMVTLKGPVGIGEVKATVDGKVACQAEITFAIV